jgi:hypothetical protein
MHCFIQFTSDFSSFSPLSLTSTLDIQGGTVQIFGNPLIVGNSSAGAARVVVQLLVSAFAGATIVSGGTLAVGADFVLNSPPTANGGKIRPLADTTFPNDTTLARGGVILDSNGFSSTFSGAFSGVGALTKIDGILSGLPAAQWSFRWG